MLENWLRSTTNIESQGEFSISNHVQTSLEAPSIRRQKVYIVTDDSKFSERSKYELYGLKNHFDNLDIYDLGILKNDNPEFVIAIIRELAGSSGRIVFLSKNDSYFDSIFRALEYSQDHILLAFLNSGLEQLHEKSTARSLQSEKLLNISALGYQRHYCTPKILSYLHESFVHHLSFGQIRQNITRAEPILRTVNAASIDTAILKNDALGIPNGLNALEICQLTKYCGMSANLKVLSISDQDGQSDSKISALIGQMLWYFLEGVCLSQEDAKVKSTEYFQEHIVQTDYSNHSFTFWKSNKTNRWWFEVPNTDGNRGNIYPCNQEDYDLACRNEISSYLLDQINLDH